MPNVENLQLVGGGERPPVGPAEEAMHALLASMACSDGTVHDKELDFLVKVRRDLPDRAAVEAWARSQSRPIDLAGLAAAVTSPDDRWKTLRFAARMAWKDGELADAEEAFLGRVADALVLPRGAVGRVLREMKPDDGRRFTAERILRVLMDVHWDAVQLASGTLCSDDLLAVTPPTTEIVARVGLEKVEVMALCTDGLCARFLEGASFIGWAELVTYTRERGLGESLRLHVEDGRRYTCVDQRLTGLALVLDRLLDLDGRKDPNATPPKIDALRGD